MRRCPRCNSFFDDTTTHCPYDSEALVEIALSGPNTRGLEGQQFANRYLIQRLLGEGGMGIVYEALDQHTNQTIAIKVLHRDIGKDERAVKRFFSEARVLSSLSHPHIIRLTDFGRSDQGSLYIAMELLEGHPAEDLIKGGHIDPVEAITIIDQVADALGEAHLQGVIHRDLKPPNIFVRRTEEGKLHCTVLDFGIAKVSGGQSLTATGKVMGTPSYMAPEQISGKTPDPRVDIYALGALGYELLTGAPPFTGDGPIGILYKHLNEKPKPLRETITINPQLDDIILKFLAKDRNERPRNILAVRELLAPFLNEPSRITSGARVLDPGLDETVAVDGGELERRLEAVQAARRDSPVTSTDGDDEPGRPRVVAESGGLSRSSEMGSRASWSMAAARPDARETQLNPPKISHPEEEEDEEGGGSMLLWLGAGFIAIIVALVLAVAVFLMLGGWTLIQGQFKPGASLPGTYDALCVVDDAPPSGSAPRT